MKKFLPYMLAVSAMVDNNPYMLPDVRWNSQKKFERREKFLKQMAANAIEKNVKVSYDSVQHKYTFTGPDGIDIYVSNANNLKRAHQDFRKYLFSFSYKMLGEIEDNYGKLCRNDV